MTELEYKLMQSLENLNLKYIELQNCKEMRIGKNAITIIEAIKHKKFSEIFLILKKRHGEKVLNKKFPGKTPRENLDSNNREKKIAHFDNEARIAVYTCIVGGYDQLRDPIFANEGYDYFVFSDNKIESSVWESKDIPKSVKLLKDKTLINRYLKMHPFELFPEYDYAVYIDGNVCIASDISALINVPEEGKVGFAMHRHVLRDCIYEEAEACILYGKGSPNQLRKQITQYRLEGFPTKYGMLEATVIFYHLQNKECQALMSEWWNEFIKYGSMRDQIALPYVLWKKGYKISDVGCLGENVYRNSKFQVLSH